MPTTIKLKNSVTTTNAPSSLVQGEVAINITDKKVWVGNAATTPIQLLGAGASINLTSLTTSNDCSISGLTVGKGAASGGSGGNSTAVGINALANANSSSYNNTAVGSSALNANTSGNSNSSFGINSLSFNTTGSNNTAVGTQALNLNTTASNNTAVGYQAGYSNTTGTSNAYFGIGTGYTNTTANDNSAFGYYALYSNTGTSNTAIGSTALYNNSSGTYNTALGRQALYSNTTASNNTAVGYQAGYSNTTGTRNTFIGYQSGYSGNGDRNVAVGSFCANNMTTGGYNTCMGDGAGNVISSGSNNTFIGNGSGGAVTTGSKNSILGMYTGNQGGLDIRTASNYAIISDGDGNPLISTSQGRSVALEGAVPQTGEGITFPATQSASSNANTLDDYEEGTWVPTIGGNATYTQRDGFYIKIGRFVWLKFLVQVSVRGTGSTAYITGLPFTWDNTGGPRSSGACNYFASLATSITSISWNIDENGIFAGTTNGSTTAITDASPIFGNNTYVMGSVTYLTTN